MNVKRDVKEENAIKKCIGEIVDLESYQEDCFDRGIKYQREEE